MSSRFVLPVVLALLVLCISPSGAEEWKGKISTRDGVSYVQNPDEPMSGSTNIHLAEVWRLGGPDAPPEEQFGLINRILVSEDGDLYFLDNEHTEIKVFSSDGEYKRTMPLDPGSATARFHPHDMFFFSNGNIGLVQMNPGRIAVVTPDGGPMPDFPLPQNDHGSHPVLIGAQPLGKNLMLVANTRSFDEGRLVITRYLSILSSDGLELKRLHEEVRPLDLGGMVIDEKVWSTFDRRWQVGPRGYAYAVLQFADYEVVVWNYYGEMEYVLSRKFKHLDRKPEEKGRIRRVFQAFTRQMPNAEVKISNSDQDISALYPRADGSLWVLSSRGMRERPPGSLGTFDVFNREGQFVRQVTMVGKGDPLRDGFYFLGDRLYIVFGYLDSVLAVQNGVSDDFPPPPLQIVCYELEESEVGLRVN